MKLIQVDGSDERHLKVLYELLAERRTTESISHKHVPAWHEHVAFVCGQPYRDWCFIVGVTTTEKIVGSVYLSKTNEIGIFLFQRWQGLGIGPQAVRAMMEKHGLKKAFANVNPANLTSIAMFEKKFNAKLIQFTYELECPGAD